METKPLLYGIVGFILGGLLVSIIATKQDKPETQKTQTAAISTSQHNQSMTDKLKGLTGDEFDKAFISEMMDHHQGAIDVAKLTATNAKHDEVKALGQSIITAQEKEISEMKQWQMDWGYSSSTMDHSMHGM